MKYWLVYVDGERLVPEEWLEDPKERALDKALCDAFNRAWTEIVFVRSRTSEEAEDTVREVLNSADRFDAHIAFLEPLTTVAQLKEVTNEAWQKLYSHPILTDDFEAEIAWFVQKGQDRNGNIWYML